MAFKPKHGADGRFASTGVSVKGGKRTPIPNPPVYRPTTATFRPASIRGGKIHAARHTVHASGAVTLVQRLNPFYGLSTATRRRKR